MRNNGPVTQREVVMPEGMMIVSKTDMKGRIEFINDDFISISGFSADELIGQPHNLIRHSDMPSEAFEDMWRDLKNGKPWSGYVKNRVKNGDHYWVHANAMPLSQGGQNVGYISIRKKPKLKAVHEVEQAYRLFTEGKAKGLRIEHGRVLNDSPGCKLKRWFERLGSKVVCMGAALCLVIASVGFFGIHQLEKTTESLRTVYEDRTVPAGQLAEINELLYSSILHLSLISSNEHDSAALIAETEAITPTIKQIWDAYMATYLTPEEKILATRYAAEQQRYFEEGLLPALHYAKNGELQALASFLVDVHELFDAVQTTNHELIQLQMDVAQTEYSKAKMAEKIGFLLSIVAIASGIVVAFFVAKYVRQTLLRKLGYVDERLQSIAGGNYNTEINTENDELQNILDTVEALQAKLAYSELEKKQLEVEKNRMQQQLADDFEHSVKGIVNVVAAASTELSHTAESMLKTAMETSGKAVDASGAAANTSSNVQMVAAAAEELSASVKEISSQLQKTSSMVTQSKEKTRNADALAAALSVATEKVATATSMISQIAGQINLLALNATIESARAGEAGRGFAIVASEVKALAGQTDKTVSEIKVVADEMREASNAIINALQDIGGSVESISEAASVVAAAVEEQSATTNEIARNMQIASSSTQEISQNLEEVRASSAHAGSASEQMLQASKELSKQAEDLNAQVDSFLSRVRSGE